MLKAAPESHPQINPTSNSMNGKMSQYRIATIVPWHITEEQFRPEMNEVAESLFSLAKEYHGDAR